MPSDRAVIRRARSLRRDMTPAERSLWAALRGRSVRGLKFRRQQPIGNFIVDFYCASLRLVVEIDGDVHADARQKERDTLRTAWLQAHDYHVIRFSNSDVLLNLNGVLDALMRYAGTAPT